MKKDHPLLDRLQHLATIEAMLVEKNVTRAAVRLGLSQPAMSHALSRLRQRMKDPLFVQSPTGMMPTPLVEQMAEPILRAIRIVRDEIFEIENFDPCTSERVFKLYTGETGALVMLPRLIEDLAKTAPRLRVELIDIPRDYLPLALDDNQVELALGYQPRLPDKFVRQKLFDSELTAIVSANHPTIQKTLSLQQLSEVEHITSTTHKFLADGISAALTEPAHK